MITFTIWPAHAGRYRVELRRFLSADHEGRPMDDCYRRLWYNKGDRERLLGRIVCSTWQLEKDRSLRSITYTVELLPPTRKIREPLI